MKPWQVFMQLVRMVPRLNRGHGEPRYYIDKEGVNRLGRGHLESCPACGPKLGSGHYRDDFNDRDVEAARYYRGPKL